MGSESRSHRGWGKRRRTPAFEGGHRGGLVRNSERVIRTVLFGQLLVVRGIVIVRVPIVGDQAQPSCRALQSFRHLIRLYLCLYWAYVMLRLPSKHSDHSARHALLQEVRNV